MLRYLYDTILLNQLLWSSKGLDMHIWAVHMSRDSLTILPGLLPKQGVPYSTL
jgi:hypothetical protein